MATSLYRMYFSVRCDREIDLDIHYISPGGYEIQLGDKNIQFDFCDFEVSIDNDDKHIIYSIQKNPDDIFPQMCDITLDELKKPDIKFIEFFIYTGESGTDEIFYPVELLSLSFEFYDDDNDKIIRYEFEDNPEGYANLIESANEEFEMLNDFWNISYMY